MKSSAKISFGWKSGAMFVAAFAITLGALATVQSLPAKQSKLAAPANAPPGMCWIAAGDFAMGTNDPNSYPNERPARRVKVGGFWMDEHDVTNAEFRRFVEATSYVTTAEKPVDWEEMKKQVAPGTPKPSEEMLKPGSLVFTPTGRPVALNDLSQWWTWTSGANWKHPQGPSSAIDEKNNYPVVQVSWDDAAAYAKWAGKRLPTEAEWEHAARGGMEGKRFAWGDEFHPSGKIMANTFTGTFPVKDTGEDGYAGTSPWNAFPPNGYGLYDMAGNVWQWTADAYRDGRSSGGCSACFGDVVPGPSDTTGPTEEVRRVIKGGSFLCHASYCESYRPTARRGTPRDTGSEHVGFRCVKSGT